MLTIKALTFFDRNIVKKNWKAINESPAKKAGLLVRKIAVRSIRKDKPFTKGGKKRKKFGSPSKAGKPPKSRAPGHPLRRIFSVPDPLGAKTTVGVLGFGGAGEPTPGVHELGLQATRWVLVPEDRQRRSIRGRFRRKRKVFKRMVVQYPKRPFMAPALEKAEPKLPEMWKGSLGG